MAVPHVYGSAVLGGLRVMGLGMVGIVLTALALWGAIAILRRAFPSGREGQPRSD